MSKSTNIGKRRAAKAHDRSEFYQERRKEIFDKAAMVFQKRGYQATTIADIAEELGTDRATLYYYFGSKQEMFQAVVRDAAVGNILAIEAIADSAGSARDKLKAAFSGLMQSYSASYPYMHVFLQEQFTTLSSDGDPWSEETRGWADRYYQAMRRILDEGVAAGEFVLPLPVGLATMAVIGTINWAHRWYKPGGAMPPERIAEGFSDILLNGLLAGRE